MRETTLVAVWRWAVACWLAITLVEALAPWLGPSRIGWWRFLAAALTVCPTMAMLGAKRPQHAAWQWVVLSLWIVLILPALESWLRGDAAVRLSGLRGWFLAGLVLLSWCNAAPGRHWAAASLIAIAQAMLLAPHVRLAPAAWMESLATAGACLAGAGIWTGRSFGAASPRRSQELPQQHAWRDFRDMFGLFWSLRLAERFNLDAARSGWNERLGLTGFCVAAGDATEPPPRPSAPPVRQNFANLLRRFTSSEWLDQRWPPGEPPAESADEADPAG